MNIDSTVLSLKRTLVRLGSVERAEQERRYLKSELAFLGVSQPVLRSEAKTFVRGQRDVLDRATLRALCEALWQTRVHELRSFAIAVLELCPAVLTKADASWLLAFIRDAKTWAHVDWLATKVLGALLVREPALGKQLDRWAKDKDFWVRRTALLALHDPILQGQGDFDHFARLAVPMLSEREFFIRKAIGWVLRSASKRAPERTYAFVKEHARELSGLSFREAVKHLPAGQQKELAALREARLR